MAKLGFVFSGQGSQYSGMGKRLYENYDVAKQVYEEASEVLGFDLGRLCFQGSPEELAQTEVTQPAILTTSIAQFRVYMQEIGVKPAFLAGHSLGEYSALVAAGAITFADALRLVRARGLFMKEASEQGSGAMTAIRNMDEKTVEIEAQKLSAEGHIIGISNYNGERDVVISGSTAAVEQLSDTLKNLGADIFKLQVSAAFHSPIMEVAGKKLKSELCKYAFSDPAYMVLSNVTASPYENKEQIVELLSEQIVKPVKWTSIMKVLEQNAVDTVIEFGPKVVLKNLVNSNTSIVKAFSYDKDEDITQLKEALGGKEKQTKFYSILSRSMGIAVATKNNNWDKDEYQKGVVEPYEKVAQVQSELEQSGREADFDHMQLAVDMLKSVFRTKKTPIEEQVARFQQLFQETNTGAYFKDFEI